MQPTNFSRNFIKHVSSYSLGHMSEPQRRLIENALYLAKHSMKFMLPDGGRPNEDKNLSAIDENEKIHIPFDCIALEYRRDTDKTIINESSKAIIFATQDEDFIKLNCICWFDYLQTWVPMPKINIARIPSIDRTAIDSSGHIGIRAIREDESVPFSDYADEVGAFMNFINLLNCSNVGFEKIQHKSNDKKTNKKSLNFDDYYVLAITSKNRGGSNEHKTICDRSSPREHFRRGHVRVTKFGKMWVSSCVVSSGAEGKIFKDYSVKSN